MLMRIDTKHQRLILGKHMLGVAITEELATTGR